MLKRLKHSPSSSILFHHRFPTSTENVKNACHPFSTKDFFQTNYVLVHNGHISNARELKAAHTELGIEYHSLQQDGSFNDSEALLWDVALYLEGEQDELKAYGGIAFICLALPKDGRKSSHLHFGRNTNPINMIKTKDMIMLSSEGDGIETKRDTLYSYNYKSKKLDMKDLTIRSYKPYEASETGVYGKYEGLDDGSWEYMPNKQRPEPGIVQRTIIPYDDNDWKRELSQYAKNEAYDDYLSDVSDLIILPTNEDYSYEGVMGKDASALMFENKTGTLLDVKGQVALKCDLYLELADGNYQQALNLLEDDVVLYRGMLLEDEALNFEDEDLVLELDLLTAANIALSSSPFYRSVSSVDPGYEDLVGDRVREMLNVEQQQKLLTA